MQMNEGSLCIIECEGLERLIDGLRESGRRVMGPVLRESAVVFSEIGSLADLPRGWTDEQEGGTYQLRKRPDGALFGYNVGPDSLKGHTFISSLRMWSARREGSTFEILHEQEKNEPLAFLGVRSCDIHGMLVLDRTLLQGAFVDPWYRARREGMFIVAVNCTKAGGTCFCSSMGTGPRATEGFDLALTELLDGGSHSFLVETGTEAGRDLLGKIPHRAAGEEEVRLAQRLVAEAASEMGRTMDTSDIKELLYRNYENLRWNDVASRCLTCGNCTLVCPTCFCMNVIDTSDLKRERAERQRVWDSCFTQGHSYVHGGSIRTSTLSRYRQWLIHKLATWVDQFGTSGCVGCGRCITWCPVAIDITEEVRAIRESEVRRKEERHGDARTSTG
jgi:ferredoxin